MASDASPGPRILALWRRLSPWPGGAWLFSRLLGRMVPYSGSMGAVVRALEPGRAVVELRDRRKVRNHLGSVHAVALANLGELASGLAVLGGQPPGVRGILVRLEVEYHKKARGRLEARSEASLAAVDARREEAVTAHIVDPGGEEVATVTAHWLLAPKETP